MVLMKNLKKIGRGEGVSTAKVSYDVWMEGWKRKRKKS